MSERRGASPVTWARELALGARFAVTGGPGWTRTALTAVGVGLGAAVLLLAASVPNALEAREERGDARSPGWNQMDPESTQDAVRFASAGTEFRDEDIGGLELQPDAGAATTVEPPPGLGEFPGPGEMVVSPALGRLLESDRGALLAERFDHEVVGTIGAEGLNGPGELFYYLGTDALPDDTGRTTAFGATPDSAGSGEPMPPALVLLIVVICVVLLMPVAVFIATAVRFGGERRDQRLAALRLVGADTDMTRRVAAGEALVGAVFGLLLGAGGFLALRQYLGTVTAWGFSAYPADMVPTPMLAALTLIGVPVSALAVSLFALRGIAIEPLGVVRQSGVRRRRLLWRLIPGMLGLALLLPMAGGSFDGGSTMTQAQAAVGVVLLLAGATMLLPWLVERVVARLGGGPVSWQLATRRLQLSSGTAARTVSGITVSVAGATALYMLFAGASGEATVATGEDTERAQIEVSAWSESGASATELAGTLESLPGVTAALSSVSGWAADPEQPAEEEYRPTTSVVVADCATLREMAHLDACADGDVFLASSPDMTDPVGVVPGQRLEVGLDGSGFPVDGGARPVSWTVPDGAAEVRARTDPTGMETVGVLATPAALDPETVADATTRVMLRTDPGDEEVLERVRNVAWTYETRPSVWELQSERTADELLDIQRALLIGATGVMTVITASMVVSMLEQLRERKRLLSALVAFGTRRTTLGASVLWQTAVPVLLGLILAAVVGTGLGALLMSMVDLPIRGWLAFLPMAGVGAGMIAVVTLVSLPFLWHLMRPDGLRTE
ncbi:FtsX-like permease family protein [Streptomyces sp. SBT349]|uniref:FtsX-like permease family protein n=1 Tax=Streptomyces sp. SBT349 TaxID=1580539 RepID=UPI00066C27CF|nr:FtsX-like permease family protein [Streptomyces sp. SBT349]